MKVADLDYEEVLFNLNEEVPEDIARLLSPQRYIQLFLNGELYNLTIIYIDKNRFIVGMDGKVEDGLK